MMKRQTSAPLHTGGEAPEPAWLALEETAEVEITSEDPEFPIEGALIPGHDRGWRAKAPGKQTIRLRFGLPRAIRRVRVMIEEHEIARTQQFTIRASAVPGGPWHELVRQQFTFSPQGATVEREDFQFDLPQAAGLEIEIQPNISGGDAHASLRELRIG